MMGTDEVEKYQNQKQSLTKLHPVYNPNQVRKHSDSDNYDNGYRHSW